MRLLLILGLFQVSWACVASKNASEVENPMVEEDVDLWFDQKLDHFSASKNTPWWRQRYFVNDTLFEKDSPVFLMISGESKADASWMQDGMCAHYTEFKPLCFQLEHRYYGKSHPTANVKVKNLKHLSSEQALADLAYFIDSMTSKYNLTQANKWVTFGCSYAGSLSAWIRLNYPDKVHAAVSVSAPLHAKADYGEYLKHLTDVMAAENQTCADEISQANEDLEIMLNQTIVGYNPEKIDEMFNLCGTVRNASSADKTNLNQLLAELFVKTLQYGMQDIEFVCDMMTNKSIGSPVERLAEANKIYRADETERLDFKYYNLVKLYQNTDWDFWDSNPKAKDLIARQWLYQTCNGFGFYQTTTLPTMFGSLYTLEFYIKQCTDIFGHNFTRERLMKGIERTNNMYGGLDLHHKVTQVVFVQGSNDPWRFLGISESNNPDAPAILINGTGHCDVMNEEREGDSEQMKDARQHIKNLLVKWLQTEQISFVLLGS